MQLNGQVSVIQEYLSAKTVGNVRHSLKVHSLTPVSLGLPVEKVLYRRCALSGLFPRLVKPPLSNWHSLRVILHPSQYDCASIAMRVSWEETWKEDYDLHLALLKGTLSLH